MYVERSDQISRFFGSLFRDREHQQNIIGERYSFEIES